MTHISNPGPLEGHPPSRNRRAALVTEALAYVGGVVVVVGAVLIAGRFWPDLPASGRLAVAGVATVVLLCGALAVPAEKAVERRLRVVIWLTSTATTALFFGLLGDEVLKWGALDTILLVGLATSVYAATLWLWSGRMVPVQLVLLASTLVAAGALGARLDPPYWTGLAVWFAALEWFLLGHGELVPSRRPTLVAAGLGMIVGVGLMMPLDAGIVLGLCTVIGLIIYSVRTWDLALVLVGAAGALQILPIAVTEWFPGRLAAPVALLIAGTGLVGAAIAMARRSRSQAAAVPEGPQPGAVDATQQDAVVTGTDSAPPSRGHRRPRA